MMLPPPRRIGEVSGRQARIHVGDRHVVLAGQRIGVAGEHRRQRIVDGRRLEGHLDPHQLRGDDLAQLGDQAVEELEGLGLVLVERVALRQRRASR